MPGSSLTRKYSPSRGTVKGVADFLVQDDNGTAAGSASRRVPRAFAFIDLSNFTQLTYLAGDERATEVLATFRQVVREVAAHEAVRVAKWLGDGAMMVSVDDAALIEAVIEIERRLDAENLALPLRAGIASGDVILFEGDDYIGAAVNMAARLCDLASPHQILAPCEWVERTCPERVLEDLGDMSVRGLDEPVHLADISDTHHR